MHKERDQAPEVESSLARRIATRLGRVHGMLSPWVQRHLESATRPHASHMAPFTLDHYAGSVLARFERIAPKYEPRAMALDRRQLAPLVYASPVGAHIEPLVQTMPAEPEPPADSFAEPPLETPQDAEAEKEPEWLKGAPSFASLVEAVKRAAPAREDDQPSPAPPRVPPKQTLPVPPPQSAERRRVRPVSRVEEFPAGVQPPRDLMSPASAELRRVRVGEPRTVQPKRQPEQTGPGVTSEPQSHPLNPVERSLPAERRAEAPLANESLRAKQAGIPGQLEEKLSAGRRAERLAGDESRPVEQPSGSDRITEVPSERQTRLISPRPALPNAQEPGEHLHSIADSGSVPTPAIPPTIQRATTPDITEPQPDSAPATQMRSRPAATPQPDTPSIPDVQRSPQSREPGHAGSIDTTGGSTPVGDLPRTSHEDARPVLAPEMPEPDTPKLEDEPSSSAQPEQAAPSPALITEPGARAGAPQTTLPQTRSDSTPPLVSRQPGLQSQQPANVDRPGARQDDRPASVQPAVQRQAEPIAHADTLPDVPGVPDPRRSSSEPGRPAELASGPAAPPAPVVDAAAMVPGAPDQTRQEAVPRQRPLPGAPDPETPAGHHPGIKMPERATIQRDVATALERVDDTGAAGTTEAAAAAVAAKGAQLEPEAPSRPGKPTETKQQVREAPEPATQAQSTTPRRAERAAEPSGETAQAPPVQDRELPKPTIHRSPEPASTAQSAITPSQQAEAAHPQASSVAGARPTPVSPPAPEPSVQSAEDASAVPSRQTRPATTNVQAQPDAPQAQMGSPATPPPAAGAPQDVPPDLPGHICPRGTPSALSPDLPAPAQDHLDYSPPEALGLSHSVSPRPTASTSPEQASIQRVPLPETSVPGDSPATRPEEAPSSPATQVAQITHPVPTAAADTAEGRPTIERSARETRPAAAGRDDAAALPPVRSSDGERHPASITDERGPAPAGGSQAPATPSLPADAAILRRAPETSTPEQGEATQDGQPRFEPVNEPETGQPGGPTAGPASIPVQERTPSTPGSQPPPAAPQPSGPPQPPPGSGPRAAPPSSQPPAAPEAQSGHRTVAPREVTEPDVPPGAPAIPETGPQRAAPTSEPAPADLDIAPPSGQSETGPAPAPAAVLPEQMLSPAPAAPQRAVSPDALPGAHGDQPRGTEQGASIGSRLIESPPPAEEIGEAPPSGQQVIERPAYHKAAPSATTDGVPSARLQRDTVPASAEITRLPLPVAEPADTPTPPPVSQTQRQDIEQGPADLHTQMDAPPGAQAENRTRPVIQPRREPLAPAAPIDWPDQGPANSPDAPRSLDSSPHSAESAASSPRPDAPQAPAGKVLARAAPEVRREEQARSGSTELVPASVRRQMEGHSPAPSPAPILPAIDAELLERLTARSQRPRPSSASTALSGERPATPFAAARAASSDVLHAPPSPAPAERLRPAADAAMPHASHAVGQAAAEAAPPPVGAQIQRAPAGLPSEFPLVSPPPVVHHPVAIIQRSPEATATTQIRRAVAPAGESATAPAPTAPDLDQLARKVYPILKRLITAEMERRARR